MLRYRAGRHPRTEGVLRCAERVGGEPLCGWGMTHSWGVHGTAVEEHGQWMLSLPHPLERQQSAAKTTIQHLPFGCVRRGSSLHRLVASSPYTPPLHIHPRPPQAVKLPAAAIPAAMAADNLCMAGFLAVLMAVPTRVAAVAAAAAGDGKGAVRVVGGMGQAPAAQLPAASASTDAGAALPKNAWPRGGVCQPEQ